MKSLQDFGKVEAVWHYESNNPFSQQSAASIVRSRVHSILFPKL